MADIGPPGSFVELRPRQVFLFDKRLKRGRRNLLVFLFIRVLANLSLGPFRLSLGSRFRDHSPIAPGFNHEVVMPTTSSFSYGHIAPFPSCSHGSEAVGILPRGFRVGREMRMWLVDGSPLIYCRGVVQSMISSRRKTVRRPALRNGMRFCETIS